MATITENPFAGLSGKSFVAFMSTRVAVDDSRFTFLGRILRIPGGCELEFDKDKLVRIIEDADEGLLPNIETTLLPLTIRDPYYPDVNVAVPWRNRRTVFNLVESGIGPRRAVKRRRCNHAEATVLELCEYCFWKWWKKELAK